MSLNRWTVGVAIAALTASVLTASPAFAATTPASPDCPAPVGRELNAADVSKLSATQRAAIATANEKTPAQLDQMLADSTFHVNACGRGFFVDPAVPANLATSPSASGSVTASAITLTQAFTLHSLPGAQRTIYLDFDGQTITGTAWNSSVGLTSWVALGYSQDGDYSTYTQSELDAIASIWARVAEDYAPFGIDVTTELPAAGVLERSSLSDSVYGTRALISADQNIYNYCGGCGGIAYVGVFDNTGTSHETYQPAWVSTIGTTTNAKYVAEAASHEVGHNLGLSHDGTSTQGYYAGANGWAPDPLGVGYYQPLAQWSNGNYPSANNTQDDYSVMAANGGPLRSDEDGNSARPAGTLTVGTSLSGIIAQPTDVDYLAVTPATSGNYIVSATPAAVAPNLDIQLTVLRASDSSQVAQFNPTFVSSGRDSATGLNATGTVALTAGVTYIISIDGVGQGDPMNGGYSDYGSLGAYTVAVSTDGTTVPAPTITTSASLPGSTTAAYSFTFAATGGTTPYTWSSTGTLPGGLSLAPNGVLSGTPSAAGTFSFTVVVTDANALTATQTVSMTVTAPVPLSITTSTLPTANRNKKYSTTLAATGGTPPYTWSLASGSLPNGLTLSPSGVISGTSNAAKGTTFTFTVRVTDQRSATATKTFTIRVQ